MKTLLSRSEEVYDGRQLHSLHNYLEHGLLGDSAVAWIAPCNVKAEHMVDGEDLRALAAIEGSQMVHFIIELFDCELFGAVSVQRLFASMVRDQLLRTARNARLAAMLRRDGDDLYADNKKLSISIATVSPVSALIHFAINVSNVGTPVETLSLQDLDVDSYDFAKAMLAALAREIVTVREATQKVKWVR